MAQAGPQKNTSPKRAFSTGCLLSPLTPQWLADGNLGQANILHHGPHDSQATRLGREGIDLLQGIAASAEQKTVTVL